EILSVVEFVVGASPASSNSCIGRATKKVRRRLDLPLDFDDPILDGNGRKLAKTIGDVMAELVDGILSITFLERVHKFIERKMIRTIVVKLLGRQIASNALLNKTTTLWNCNHHFQLMDLENDFYLAIGQTIGPILNVDENTNIAKMGCFARLVGSDGRDGAGMMWGTRIKVVMVVPINGFAGPSFTNGYRPIDDGSEMGQQDARGISFKTHGNDIPSNPLDDKKLRLKDPLMDVSLEMEGILHRTDQDLVIVPRDDEDSMLVEGSDVVGSFGTDNHPHFHNFVNEYKREFSLDLMGLFETRISSSRVNAIIGKLGFHNSFRIEAVGFAGVIWILWNNNIEVNVLDLHPQLSLAGFVFEPWILVRDFNSILENSEQTGGSSNTKVGCNPFRFTSSKLGEPPPEVWVEARATKTKFLEVPSNSGPKVSMVAYRVQ
ncbi:hypothetical protein Goari_021185, partial [Gossypium aridum]|nr:hypothetical protein [Gossypium aridum]